MFNKILIANRGEIACRIIRTAKRLGIETVAVFSDADRNALHVTLADEAVHWGFRTSSFLSANAAYCGCRKDHGQSGHSPGIRFFVENAAFCELCAANGLVFIGPPVQAIEAMGSRLQPSKSCSRPAYRCCPAITTTIKRIANCNGPRTTWAIPCCSRPLPAVAARYATGESLGRVQRGLGRGQARGSGQFRQPGHVGKIL